MTPRHLLSMSDLGAGEIGDIMRLADSFSEVSARPIPKVPTLRGRTVALLFFEESTRTRLSFETAAKRMSADIMTFSASTSSLKKGESLRDTVLTLDAMGVDVMVVRHSSAGAPVNVARWTRARVINAGDGWHEHPTQALLDCYTIRQWRGLGWTSGTSGAPRVPYAGVPRPAGDRFMAGLRVAIVGDVKHSRVARSNVTAFHALGADVTLVAPPTLLPASLRGWPVTTSTDLDDVLPKADVVYLLRIQSERTDEALVPSSREYTARWGLTLDRARRMSPTSIVMHPGPMNRGVEIAPEVADMPISTVTAQVHNGIAVRMAAILLASEGSTVAPPVTAGGHDGDRIDGDQGGGTAGDG